MQKWEYCVVEQNYYSGEQVTLMRVVNLTTEGEVEVINGWAVWNDLPKGNRPKVYQFANRFNSQVIAELGEDGWEMVLIENHRIP